MPVWRTMTWRRRAREWSPRQLIAASDITAINRRIDAVKAHIKAAEQDLAITKPRIDPTLRQRAGAET